MTLAMTAGCFGATPRAVLAGDEAPREAGPDETIDGDGNGDGNGGDRDGDDRGVHDDHDDHDEGANRTRDSRAHDAGRDRERSSDDRTSIDRSRAHYGADRAGPDRDRDGADRDHARGGADLNRTGDERDRAGNERACERDDLGDLICRALRAGPPVSEVIAAAYAAAGLDRGLGRGFAARARLGGLVPWVSVRTGRDASWHDEDPDVGRGTTLEVRATWRLDRLVFDPRELQVVALEAARRRERRRLATHVIRTYFVWKRSGSRADEAGAELDGLTNGWFSEADQRGASESRTVRAPAAPP